MKPGKHQKSKQRCPDILEGPRPCTIFCFELIHTLWMNYVTNTFLLVSSSVRSKQLLCFVQGQAQKAEQKHTTKYFVEFHNHSPLLTMITTHMGWGNLISSLDFMLRVVLIPRGLINHGGDKL